MIYFLYCVRILHLSPVPLFLMANRTSYKSPFCILVEKRIAELNALNYDPRKLRQMYPDRADREIEREANKINKDAVASAACVSRSCMYQYFRADPMDRMEITPNKDIIIRFVVALGLIGDAGNELMHSCGLDVSYGKCNEPYRRLINGPTDEEKARKDYYEEDWARELLCQCGIPKDKCDVEILTNRLKS